MHHVVGRYDKCQRLAEEPVCHLLFSVLIITTIAVHFKVYKIGQSTVMPAKSDSDIIFCLQSYQGFIIDRSLVC